MKLNLKKHFAFANMCTDSVYSLQAINPYFAFSTIRSTIQSV